MQLNDGETLIAGKSRAKAQTLIAGAERLGLDVQVIRTQRDGYIVPEELAVDFRENFDAENGVSRETFSGFHGDPLDTNHEPWTPDVQQAAPAAPKPPKVKVPKAKAQAEVEAPAQSDEEIAAADALHAQEQEDQRLKAEADKIEADRKAFEASQTPPTETQEEIDERNRKADADTAAALAASGGASAADAIVAEPVSAGTEVTPENAGVITDENGTEHIGTTPPVAVEDSKDGEPAAQEAPAAEPVAEPAKNASRDEWAAYVASLPNHDPADLVPVTDDDNPGLGRNDLVAKYGTPADTVAAE